MGVLEWLFDTEGFQLPGEVYGAWTEGLTRAGIISNLVLCLVYFIISGLLLAFTLRDPRHRRERAAVWGFALFIGLEALTHGTRVVMFLHPMYRLQVTMNTATAVVAWVTVAVWLPILMRRAAIREQTEAELRLERMEEMQRELMLRERRIDALLEGLTHLPRLSGETRPDGD